MILLLVRFLIKIKFLKSMILKIYYILAHETNYIVNNSEILSEAIIPIERKQKSII